MSGIIFFVKLGEILTRKLKTEKWIINLAYKRDVAYIS